MSTLYERLRSREAAAAAQAAPPAVGAPAQAGEEQRPDGEAPGITRPGGQGPAEAAAEGPAQAPGPAAAPAPAPAPAPAEPARPPAAPAPYPGLTAPHAFAKARIAGRPALPRPGEAAQRPGLPTIAPGAAQVPAAAVTDRYRALKTRIQRRLLDDVDPTWFLGGPLPEDRRRHIADRIAHYLREERVNPVDQADVAQALFAEILGYGPIQPLLEDTAVDEIMVNGPHQVYVERSGRLAMTDVSFEDDRQVMQLIEKIVAPLGRRIDESSPMVDARLPDGSRVNAVIPPLSLKGPTLTIRKFARRPLQVDDLVGGGTFTSQIATFLEACVRGRLNVVVSGGTGSGKTTTLNVLSSFVPPDERIVTIEDAAELQLRQDHVVSLETRPHNAEGRGEVTVRDLVKNALRMRPDRIIVGEVRSGEALDMLQAMNTGHDGSLTTLHSNGPRDTLARLETMVLMAGFELPVRAIREQIASALDLIVHQARARDGRRRLTHVTEVQGMEGEHIVLQDVFLFEEAADGGAFRAMGIRPRFTERLSAYGIEIEAAVFG